MDELETRVLHAVEAALDKQATNLDVLDVAKLTSIGDYFMICTASNERQSQAIADAIDTRVRELDKVKPLAIEGAVPGRWVLLDYGDFIVHVFTEECRRFYGLERLWGDAPNVTPRFAASAEPVRNEQAV